MLHLFAAVIATLSFNGDVPADGGDYFLIEFEVPEGVVEIEIQHLDGSDANIIDWGLSSPAGFRGWGGGLEEPAIVGPESSRGYLPGAVEAGTWTVILGKALIPEPPASYDIQVILKDASTLEARTRSAQFDRVLGTGPGWYQGDFHVHSRESGDATATFEEIHTLAVERGLDFVSLSDHNTVSQHALAASFQEEVDDLLFMRSCEVTTYAGHGGALGISSYVNHRIGHDGRTASQMIGDVDAQGGLFIVNHPNLDLGSACIGCAWTHEDTPWDQVGAIELHTGSFDYVPVFGRTNLQMWDGLLDEGYRITGVGGSDDHRAGLGVGATQSPIGSPTTVVYADELSEAGIIKAVREGRVVLKLRSPDDPMLELDAKAGKTQGMIGDTLVGETIRLNAVVRGGMGKQLVLYEDGERVEDVVTIDSDEFAISWSRKVPEAGARYRAHVVEGANNLVITNHIFVQFEADEGQGCGCESSGSSSTYLVLVGIACWLFRRGAAREKWADTP